MVEQKPEELRVGGSIPSLGTIKIYVGNDTYRYPVFFLISAFTLFCRSIFRDGYRKRALPVVLFCDRLCRGA